MTFTPIVPTSRLKNFKIKSINLKFIVVHRLPILWPVTSYYRRVRKSKRERKDTEPEIKENRDRHRFKTENYENVWNPNKRITLTFRFWYKVHVGVPWLRKSIVIEKELVEFLDDWLWQTQKTIKVTLFETPQNSMYV